MAADFFLGESLVGDGNEVAHIDLIIGSKSGHAGPAFANALTNNKDGFTTLLAVVAPNLPAKPDTILYNKVTIKGAKQAVQMFGPAQAAVARAVVDSVSSGVIPRDKVDDLCIIVGVFIHWDAKDDKKIFDFNYRATKESIARALKKQPKIDTVISGAKTAHAPVRRRRRQQVAGTPQRSAQAAAGRSAPARTSDSHEGWLRISQPALAVLARVGPRPARLPGAVGPSPFGHQSLRPARGVTSRYIDKCQAAVQPPPACPPLSPSGSLPAV